MAELPAGQAVYPVDQVVLGPDMRVGRSAARYPSTMTIELPQAIETELRTVAEKQGRDILAVIEDAVQQYLEGAAITDLGPTAVAAAQIAVLGDLAVPLGWHDDPT